jgi:predicted ester cyclase
MASETAVRSNTEIIREYTQRVFNEHSPDRASEFLAPEVKWHGGLLGTVEGVENVTEMLRGFLGALPDLHAAEQDVVAADDSVAMRYVVEARHEGNLLGIAPTGRRVRWDAVDVFRLADGMVVEEWVRRRPGVDPASSRRVHAAVALGSSLVTQPAGAQKAR